MSWRPNASMYIKLLSNQTMTMKDKETLSRSSALGKQSATKCLHPATTGSSTLSMESLILRFFGLNE